MTSPELLYALRWLVWDTVRQALAARICWVILAGTALCVAFCLSISIDGGEPLRNPDDTELYSRDGKPLTGPNPDPGWLSLAFGAVRLPLFRDGAAEVRFLQAILARAVAGAAGLLLALFWTAGLLPEALQPAAASVLLTKPVPRWCLLAGKYLGAVALVGAQAVLFFGGTWLALGLRTGCWPVGYLMGAPLLTLHFALVYGFSVMLAVWTRSTVASLCGALLFWLVCLGVNYGRHAALAAHDLAPEAAAAGSLHIMTEACYWLLPKPADLLMILDAGLGLNEHLASAPALERAWHGGHVLPELSVLTSLLTTAALLAVSAHKLAATDY